MNDEMLILLVEEHPELYKTNLAYKLCGRKAMIWEQIAEQLGESGDTCRNRWKNLRERYARELRKAESPSGSGAQYYRQWYLLDTMRFLKPHITARPIRCSQNVCQEASTSAQHSPISKPIFVTTTTTQPLLSPAMPVASPNMPIASQNMPVAPPSSSAPVLPVVQHPSSPLVFETHASTIIAVPISSPPQKATPQSPAIDLSAPSKSTYSQQIPSPSQSSDRHSRGSGSKKRGNTGDVARSMCEAIELFKKKCIAVEEAGNPAVESFGKMIVSMISQMTLKANPGNAVNDGRGIQDSAGTGIESINVLRMYI